MLNRRVDNCATRDNEAGLGGESMSSEDINKCRNEVERLRGEHKSARKSRMKCSCWLFLNGELWRGTPAWERIAVRKLDGALRLCLEAAYVSRGPDVRKIVRERERKVGSNLVKDKAKSKRRKTKGRAKVISARRSNGCDYKKKSRFLNVTTVERNVLSTSWYEACHGVYKKRELFLHSKT